MSIISENRTFPAVSAALYTILFAFATVTITASPSTVSQLEKSAVAKVWAGHPVNFALKTEGDFQCIAYFDTARNMVAASRTIGSTGWTNTVLPSSTGWDSHNYLELAFDDSGYIHVSGNMHNATKLIYFRSKKPWNTTSFDSPGMVGTLEGSITYPVFIKNQEKKLFFQYRDGGSGSGTTIWNGYDVVTKKWSRITSKGLFDGEGQVSPYHIPPASGPDGFFHVIWMWRETPVANTNFRLSHIKSRDFVNWMTMAGSAVTIPVKQSTPGVVVDPIGSGKGLINMDYWISWDKKGRAVATYHRYDNASVSQIFNTRWEENAWKIYQTSSWSSFKWNLDREGSLTHDIAASPLAVDENGELVQDYIYRSQKQRRWILDEATLKPKTDTVYLPPPAMAPLYEVESTFPGMQTNLVRDGEYYLRWETMPINQDKERSAGTYPSSSILELYRFGYPTKTAAPHTVSLKNEIICNVSGRFITLSGLPNTSAGNQFTYAVSTLRGQLVRFGQLDKQTGGTFTVGSLAPGSYKLAVSSRHPRSGKGELLVLRNIIVCR